MGHSDINIAIDRELSYLKTKPIASRHMSLFEAEREFDAQGWDWSGYYKFCLTRNPWYRYISWFRMLLSQGARLPDNKKGFKRFLETRFRRPSKSHLFWLQSPYFAYESGEMGVDYLGKFENLPDVMDVLLNHVGIDDDLVFPNQFNVDLSQPRYDLDMYYDDESRKIVEKVEAVTISTQEYRYGWN